MIENFKRHQAEFEQLAQMFLADEGLTRVAYDFTRPADPATIGAWPERIRQYRNFFSTLNLSAGVDAGVDSLGKKDTVHFIASTQGLSVTGSSKGYAYVSTTPTTLVADLDKYWSKDGRSFTAYRHIEGNWYLYFEYED